jgi:hypothetical protein
MSIKVGVQGRILLGPFGTHGSVEIPLRYAVAREGPEPKLIVTKFKSIGATIAAGQTRIEFVDNRRGFELSIAFKCGSKYPPAKPGALVLEPLKAACPGRTTASVPATLWNAHTS